MESELTIILPDDGSKKDGPSNANANHAKFAGSGPGYAEHTKISQDNILGHGRRSKAVRSVFGAYQPSIITRNNVANDTALSPTTKLVALLDYQTKLAYDMGVAHACGTKPPKRTELREITANRYGIHPTTIERQERKIKRGESDRKSVV